MRFKLFILVGLLLSGSTPVTAQVPQDPSIQAGRLLVRGMTRAYLNDHDGAVSLFEQALKLSPSDTGIIGALAQSESKLGNTARALDLARQALLLTPKDEEMALLAARILLVQGRVDEAMGVLEGQATASPEDPVLWLRFGRLLQEFEQRTDALEAFRKATDGLPTDPEAHQELLTLEIELGLLEEALTTLSRLEMLSEPSSDLWATRGRLLVQMGRREEGVAAFEQALMLDPSDEDLIAAIADLGGTPSSDLAPRAEAAVLLTNRDQAAAARALSLLQGLPESAEIRLLMGRALLYSGNPGEGAPLLAGAAQSNPRDVQLWQEATEAALRAGRPGMAALLTADALLFYPGNSVLLTLEMERQLQDLDLQAALTTHALIDLSALNDQWGARCAALAALAQSLSGISVSIELPDPNTDELSALRSLTDASAYSGAVQGDVVWTALASAKSGGGAEVLQPWVDDPDGGAYVLAAAAALFREAGRTGEASLVLDRARARGASPAAIDAAGR